jgi:pimeloyl-ACP methyl ester carboxylesterase
MLTACVVGGQAARCRYVWVPQDWAHPRGPQIPLKVVVLPASTAHPAADPVFYLAGLGGQAAGVGDAVENGLTWASGAFSPLNRTRDLVFAEQRGTPGSGLQTCQELQLSAALSLAAARAWARRCLASARRDPRHDTTISAARDLDQVRQALGYTKINLYGVSYGSRWDWPTCSATARMCAPGSSTAAHCSTSGSSSSS